MQQSQTVTDVSNDHQWTPLATACALAAAVMLGGCGVLKDHTLDYTEAVEGQPLRGVEGEPLPRQREAYPVREISATGATGHQGRTVPRPPDMTSDILEENYVIESLGDQSWLLVNDVPGRVWSSVNTWMNEKGLGVASDSAQLGLLQSELVNYSRRARTLLELDDATPGEELMLVQARIVGGVRRRTTEIQVRPVVVSSAPDVLLQWRGQPLDQALEESLLADLSEFLQAREESRIVSRAALGMEVERRVHLETGPGDSPERILIGLPYDRTWNEVRRILSDEDTPVLDLDQTAGYFLVDGRSAEARQRGWPARWFLGRERAAQVNTRIELTRDGDQVIVTASKAEGFRGEDYSAAVLARLYDYLY